MTQGIYLNVSRRNDDLPEMIEEYSEKFNLSKADTVAEIFRAYLKLFAYKHREMEQENRLFGKIAAGALDLNDKEVSRLYEEDLYQLILHEVGHTLGLNHNFAASTLHNNSDIHNPDVTYKEGLSASVMDYHALNIAPLGVKQGQYADIKPGKYDILAIKYGYTCLLYTSPSPRDRQKSRMPSSA